MIPRGTWSWPTSPPDCGTRSPIDPTMTGPKHGLSDVGSCAKKLHLLPNRHRRYTTRNSVVITKFTTHDIVIFILNRTCLNRHHCTIFLEVIGQFFRP